MLVLALDTTALTASAAVVAFENGVPDKYSLITVKNRLTHSENLMPMIDKALSSMEASIKDIGLIAVCAGPGSFTGVRIGVATVKGLAFTNNIPCVAVSTLEAIAENLAGTGNLICPVMDARRNQLYNALFDENGRVCDDRLVSAEQLLEELKATGRRVMVCGDGTKVFMKTAGDTERIFPASFASADQNALSVAYAGYKAYTQGKAISSDKLQPVYLRASQAEREREEKLK